MCLPLSSTLQNFSLLPLNKCQKRPPKIGKRSRRELYSFTRTRTGQPVKNLIALHTCVGNGCCHGDSRWECHSRVGTTRRAIWHQFEASCCLLFESTGCGQAIDFSHHLVTAAANTCYRHPSVRWPLTETNIIVRNKSQVEWFQHSGKVASGYCLEFEDWFELLHIWSVVVPPPPRAADNVTISSADYNISPLPTESVYFGVCEAGSQCSGLIPVSKIEWWKQKSTTPVLTTHTQTLTPSSPL